MFRIVERGLDECITIHFHHIQNAGLPRRSKISRMVTVVVWGSAKAARASGIDIRYAVYFFLSVTYR
jgi:hypothetical protein